MDLIARNPYRILGVFANDSNRVRTANIGKIRAFLKVGKDVHFDIDAQNLLGPLERNQEMIERANVYLADEKEAALQALFWFHSANSYTASVIKELSSENAIRILTSDEANTGSYVCVLNRAITFLAIEDFASAIKQYSLFLESPSDIRAFREAINFPLPPNGSTSNKYFVQLFIERLMEGYPNVDWWEYFLQSSTKKTVLIYIKSVFEKLALAKINDNINNAKQERPIKSIEWLRIAQRLRRDCIRHVKVLQPLEGNTPSAESLLVLDKLSSELVREGKLYYQSAKTENEQSVLPTLQLVDYALSLASSNDVKESGTTFKKELEKDIKLLPPKEVREEDEAIKSEIKEYCKKTDEIRWSIMLVNNCIPHLKSIKEKLGSNNTYYIHVSTKIADNALYNSNVEVKQVERQYNVSSLGGNRAKLINSLRKAWELLLYLQKLNLSEEFTRGKLHSNVELVKKKLELYNVAYSDIVVNVNLLTEMEILQKKWKVELEEYPKELTVKNLLAYKAKFPNSHKDAIVQKTLESLFLKANLWTIDDYRQYISYFPKGIYRQKALDRISDIAFASYSTIEEFNRYVLNNPQGKYYEEALRKIEDLIYASVLKNGRYEEYLQRYPHGQYVEDLRRKQEYNYFKRCKNNKDYKDYLKAYPKGYYADLAKGIIKKNRDVVLYSVCGFFVLGFIAVLILTTKTYSSEKTSAQKRTEQKEIVKTTISNANEEKTRKSTYSQNNTSRNSNESHLKYNPALQSYVSNNSAKGYLNTNSYSTSNSYTKDYSNSSSSSSVLDVWKDNHLSTGSRPYKGYFGKSMTGDNYINFKTRGECDYVIIVKRSSDDRYADHIYIRGGESVTMYLPDGYYNVYFYSGKGWNPGKKKGKQTGGFVSMESQQKDGPINLISAWCEYTLYPVSNGNLRLVNASEEEMFN